METIDHLQLASEVFLRQVLEHSGVDKTFHEQTPILWQTEAWQPFVADPLVVHLTECQVLYSMRQNSATSISIDRLVDDEIKLYTENNEQFHKKYYSQISNSIIVH